ncbi:hypothetical protein IEO21_10466 [Rhodonia placenta]|uniref:Uncharacterized protein n=1 Tax=Rhodonia placenta TaxID=104341 RepID=A0A8H7NSJ1_9APHY|nr:hypothetical protein IEO21_10466 [Postia placenta]
MSNCCSTFVVCLSVSSHVVKVSNSILRSRSPYPDQSAGPLNSAENSAVVHFSRMDLSAQSLASSTDKRLKLRSLGQQRPAYIQERIRAGCVHWSMRSWSVHSMLTRPRGPYRGCGFEPAERKKLKNG